MKDTYISYDKQMNQVQKLYTKQQLLWYAKGYGLKVNNVMSKQQICEILAYGKAKAKQSPF